MASIRLGLKSRSSFCTLLMVFAVLLFLTSAVGMLTEREPFHTWFYCFAWWSTILFLEALLHYRWNASLLFTRPGRFFALLPLSVLVWLTFEAFNFRLQNWRYVDLIPATPLRWLGYTISFATVLPGIFAMTRLVENLGSFNRIRTKPLADARRLYAPFTVTGTVFLLLPLLWPDFFFPLIWGGFVFLLEPVNHRSRAPSLLREWESGSLLTFYRLLLAGLACGFLWEFWNFWAGAKWIYTIPYVGFLKLFEMPILGFLGFPPFAVGCYVMVNSFPLLWDGLSARSVLRGWDARPLLVAALFLLALLVYVGIDAFTVLSFRELR